MVYSNKKFCLKQNFLKEQVFTAGLSNLSGSKNLIDLGIISFKTSEIPAHLNPIGMESPKRSEDLE